MKKIILSLAAFVLLGLVLESKAQDPKRWITNLPSSYNNKVISQMTIPGTHDSGTKNVDNAAFAQCQNTTITEQLARGIRFFDMRVQPKGGTASHAYLTVYHGTENCHLKFDDAVNEMKNFLIHNPQEFIIMLVKNEDCQAREVDILFERKYGVTRTDGGGADKYFWMNTYLPMVKEIRGKIVLLRRFKATYTKGIYVNWRDNSIRSGNKASGGPCIVVQDKYNMNFSRAYEKVNGGSDGNVSTLLNEAASNNSYCLFMNFCNIVGGVGIIPSPGAVADEVNRYLGSKFNNQGHYGCVIMDMPGSSLVKKIYMTNR